MAGTQGTAVQIEEGPFRRRIRRPLDLLRFVVAVAITAGIVLAAYFATSTTAGLEDDLTSGVSMLPGPVVLILNIVGGAGSLGLPIAAAVGLVIRGRGRLLLDALLSLLFAILVLSGIAIGVGELNDPQLLVALAGSTNPGSAATAPILGGLIAFITASRLMSRRPWDVLSGVVIASVVTVTVLSGGITVAGVGLSISVGWAVGLITRYAFGTPTTRPAGADVVAALARAGLPVTSLIAQETTSRGRRYRATATDGSAIRVHVLDRDLEGSGLIAAVMNWARLRDEPGTGAFNMRRSLDHAALMTYSSERAGIPVPNLRAVSEVGPDATLLAFDYIDGTSMRHLADASLNGANTLAAPVITENEMVQTWRAVQALHGAQLSHRSLSADHLLRDAHGTIWLLGGESGSIAASDVAMRIDIAELLCTLALLSDVDTAVATGRQVLGVNGLARALPVLQRVALSSETRKDLRRDKKLLVRLRDALVEIEPTSADIEPISLQRVKPRTLVMIVVGSIAGYVLLSQMASVDFGTLFSEANWTWVLIAFLLSLITYVAAAWSLSGFVPEKISLLRTVLAQLAGNFATLVSPPTLGSVAINLRYLQKAGLHPALAAASIGVSQVMALVMHLGLLFAFGIAAGTQSDFRFDPPRGVLIAIVVIVILILALLAVPVVRRQITKRIGPTMREVGPRLVTVAQRPMKLLEGLGGMLLLNLAFIGVLVASVEAFGGSMPIAIVAVVYLAGATLGQAAPTPGGLGAVEAALAAGLTAGGLDGGLAVSSVLLFRLITFWIPTVPGYWSFNFLTKKGAL